MPLGLLPNNQTFTSRFSLSGSVIKLIALVSMTLDHLAGHFFSNIQNFRQVLFVFHGHDCTWSIVFHMIGRTAFPLFAFLIVEGFLHTSNRRKYGISLLIFAIISEIPWNLVRGGDLFYPRQNVFFTLFLGYLGICAWEKFKECQWKQWSAVLMLLVLSYFLRADYSYIGFGTILLLYLLRSSRFAQGLGVICIIPTHLLCLPASLCICLYNGKRGFIRGRGFKYFFYAYYPLHLLVLWMVSS